MRETDWAPARSLQETLFARPGLSARALTGIGQTLVSGDLDAAMQALAPGAPMLGLYGLAPDGPHALRIARDRALIVAPAPLAVEDGFRDGFFATCLDDAYAVIAVEGEAARDALMQGCAADLAAGSPSAAVLFAGFRTLLARTGRGFRLHVERPWAEALATWLEGAA